MHERYSRQQWIPAVGEAGQDSLADSRVAVVGAGGVKSPLLLYLAAAGVGTITIVDSDRVELSNLNRQILYRTNDLGRYKSEAAQDVLTSLNPDICVSAIVEHATCTSYDRLLGGHDLIIEGGEGADERRAFNRWALAAGHKYIHASAQFNYAYVFTVDPGRSACFECTFEDLPSSHRGPVPIIGPAAGVAGSVAASEALGMLMGMPPSLTESIFFFDGWENKALNLPNPRNLRCPACGYSG